MSFPSTLKTNGMLNRWLTFAPRDSLSACFYSREEGNYGYYTNLVRT